MTSEPQSILHFQPQLENLPVKDDDPEAAAAISDLSKNAKQQYMINEIKKLVADCDDFIGMVPGPGGVPEIVVSPNLRKHRFMIIGESHATFRAVLSMLNSNSKDPSCGPDLESGKTLKQEPSARDRAPNGSISLTVQRPLKRHRSRASTSRDASNPKPRHGGGGGTKVLESSAAQIRVDDTERLAKWYKEAFFRLQQVACRLVAKAWIKKIHPKKQSTHPYNGQMPRNTTPDPNRTRPDYWPSNVLHKEPDHIGQRTQLLVHLITKTPQPVVTNPPADDENRQYVYARDLLDCLEPKRGERELTNGRWETIQQIIRAREMQERYARGEIDADTLIFLHDYSDSNGSRLTTVNSDDEEVDDTAPGISSEGSDAAGEDREPTPESSSGSPIDQPNMSRPAPLSRPRRSADSLAFPGRRIATCRPRPNFNSGQPTPTIAIQTGPGFAPDLTMSMENGMAHGDAGMLPLVGLHQQVPSNMFGRIPNHTSPTEMMHAAGHTGHPAAHLHIPSWSGGIPDMGPGPPPEMFGIAQPMTTPAMRHSYFGQETLDMSGEMQTGMHPTIVSPAQYQEYVDTTHRALPFRAAETPHPTMMPEQDVSMQMMGGHYY